MNRCLPQYCLYSANAQQYYPLDLHPWGEVRKLKSNLQ